MSNQETKSSEAHATIKIWGCLLDMDSSDVIDDTIRSMNGVSDLILYFVNTEFTSGSREASALILAVNELDRQADILREQMVLGHRNVNDANMARQDITQSPA